MYMVPMNLASYNYGIRHVVGLLQRHLCLRVP